MSDSERRISGIDKVLLGTILGKAAEEDITPQEVLNRFVAEEVFGEENYSHWKEFATKFPDLFQSFPEPKNYTDQD